MHASEDQILIRDAAESFLGDVSSSAAVRAAMARPEGHDPAVWGRMRSELGWCGLAIPEALGGLGLGAPELVLLLEQAGRHLLCAPFVSTVCLAANLLQQVADEAAQTRLLPLIADGSLQATAAMPATPDWASTAASLRAMRTASGWQLDGEIPRIPDAGTAGLLLVLARVDGAAQPALFALAPSASGLQLEALSNWDATRRFHRATFTAVALAPEARIDAPARSADGLKRAAALAQLYLAAEALGCAQQCLDLTVAYVATRQQFGRPVGAFQAVKHRCAEMMIRVESARSGVVGAAQLAATAVDTTSLAMDCAMARVLTLDTQFYCAQEAIQLHGGVGFTWEYDPQLYFKRAQAGSHWFGTADALRAEISEALLS